jgi:hypothetical protein
MLGDAPSIQPLASRLRGYCHGGVTGMFPWVSLVHPLYNPYISLIHLLPGIHRCGVPAMPSRYVCPNSRAHRHRFPRQGKLKALSLHPPDRPRPRERFLVEIPRLKPAPDLQGAPSSGDSPGPSTASPPGPQSCGAPVVGKRRFEQG